jgi:DNA-binding response OmpR family regulator
MGHAMWTAVADPLNKLDRGTDARGKLLVVDDQASITKVVGLVASKLGLEVKTINDPLGALDAFLEFEPDILILDMIMPEKDGVDVLNEILLTGHKVSVILTSGFSEAYLRLAEGVAKFHDREAISVLRKPFRRDELIAKLESLLRPA